MADGRHADAAVLYFDRIHASTKWVFAEHGMEALNLAMLESLFADGVARPPRVHEGNVPGVLSQLGHAYRVAGRLLEAKAMHFRVRENEKKYSAQTSSHVSRVALLCGSLREALTEMRRATDEKDDTLHELFHREAVVAVLAAALAVLLKREASIAKGSGEPNKNKVGTVTMKQVEQIAKLKLPDLNCSDLKAAVQTVMGTARSMGVEVSG